MTNSWNALCRDAPDLGRTITACFNANLHHVIGTLRADGSVRLSGTEVVVDPDHVGLGMMPDSHKLDDVRRDSRVEIHSAPIEDELSRGDAKLAGRLIENGAVEGQPGAAFDLEIAKASVVRVVDEQLEFTTWSPSKGLRVHYRT